MYINLSKLCGIIVNLGANGVGQEVVLPTSAPLVLNVSCRGEEIKYYFCLAK